MVIAEKQNTYLLLAHNWQNTRMLDLVFILIVTNILKIQGKIVEFENLFRYSKYFLKYYRFKSSE